MSPPLRIAVLHPDLGVGGAERLIVDAARCLVQGGHTVTLYTAGHDPARCFPETLDGTLDVRVHGRQLPLHLGQRLRAPATILRMAHLARIAAHTSPSPDVVICDLVAHVLPLVARWMPQARRIFYCHYPDRHLARPGGPLLRLYRRPVDHLEARGMKRADVVLANSAFTRRAILETFPGLDPGRVRTLFPGVRPLAGPPASGRPATAPVVLSVLRFSPEKNAVLLVDAFARLRAYLSPDDYARCRLIIAGGYDPRLRDNRDTLAGLEQRIESAGLGSRITLMPGVPGERLKELLEHCRCVAHPSRGEHFGIVPVEAMAAAKPVIAVNEGGPRETIIHGQTGLLCAPTPDAFAEAMARLLADPSLARTLGRQGVKQAKRFSPESFCRGLTAAVAD